MSSAKTSADRLARLLNLVPYLLARPGIELVEAAADLGVSDRQLREDLELLWVCGLPGYGPGDLIDMSFDGDRVTITYDAGIDRPLRLTPDEATALVVALRMLAETPGVADRDAIHRALTKIEQAAGEIDAPVAVRLPGNDDRLADLRSALERGNALRLSYYSAARDVSSERVVDPMRLLSVSGRSYLEAWCRSAGAVRMFRVDRIDALVELDERAAPPAEAQSGDVAEGVFQPDPDAPTVTLRVGRGGRWITEYYPCESVVEVTPEEWLVSLRVNDMDWARRLVLGLGPQVVVVAPAELADAVRDSAVQALAAYA
ncbi:helix-turn-helix transcriptional regulator [Catellatospora citrea]|uniref:Protein pafC n=1 Tax=Catellatospora citrea TaxID=53366 RepID=A0A8J3P2S3_9ACTN|nr:YafY family protein [Catellatospora citrea]RKE06471.1 proteasome accessory factor C [Catellatospora citrea]GIG01774.1 protein pafC [Catellatospora citrea]